MKNSTEVHFSAVFPQALLNCLFTGKYITFQENNVGFLKLYVSTMVLWGITMLWIFTHCRVRCENYTIFYTCEANDYCICNCSDNWGATSPLYPLASIWDANKRCTRLAVRQGREGNRHSVMCAIDLTLTLSPHQQGPRATSAISSRIKAPTSSSINQSTESYTNLNRTV